MRTVGISPRWAAAYTAFRPRPRIRAVSGHRFRVARVALPSVLTPRIIYDMLIDKWTDIR